MLFQVRRDAEVLDSIVTSLPEISFATTSCLIHTRFSKAEFIFRDAKQFTGLTDAQTRNPKKLDFHFNASLSALNLAKYDDSLHSAQTNSERSPSPFSMASYKWVAFNDHLLEQFIAKLDLKPTAIKSHPNYQNLRSYGTIAI